MSQLPKVDNAIPANLDDPDPFYEARKIKAQRKKEKRQRDKHLCNIMMQAKKDGLLNSKNFGIIEDYYNRGYTHAERLVSKHQFYECIKLYENYLYYVNLPKTGYYTKEHCYNNLKSDLNLFEVNTFQGRIIFFNEANLSPTDKSFYQKALELQKEEILLPVPSTPQVSKKQEPVQKKKLPAIAA